MACWFDHNWGWPHKRGGKDIQVCLDCGSERESKVRFDGPRYRRTQEGVRVLGGPQLRLEPDSRRRERPGLSILAA